MTSTRQQFIEATCELLELQGYHATGLNQIIQESGGPKGSLYYHFPGGKEELTAKALQHVGGIVERRIREHLGTEAIAADAVQTFIEYIAYNVERSGYRAGGPITAVAIEVTATSDHLRTVCDSIYTSWQRAFSERLQDDAITEEQAERLAFVIIASIEGGIILSRTSQNTQPLRNVAQAMHDLIRAQKAE